MKPVYNFIIGIFVLIMMFASAYVGHSEGVKHGELTGQKTALKKIEEAVDSAKKEEHNTAFNLGEKAGYPKGYKAGSEQGYGSGYSAGLLEAQPEIRSVAYLAGREAGFEYLVDSLSENMIGVGDSSEKVLLLFGEPDEIESPNGTVHYYWYGSGAYIKFNRGVVDAFSGDLSSVRKQWLDDLRGVLYEPPANQKELEFWASVDRSFSIAIQVVQSDAFWDWLEKQPKAARLAAAQNTNPDSAVLVIRRYIETHPELAEKKIVDLISAKE